MSIKFCKHIILAILQFSPFFMSAGRTEGGSMDGGGGNLRRVARFQISEKATPPSEFERVRIQKFIETQLKDELVLRLSHLSYAEIFRRVNDLPQNLHEIADLLSTRRSDFLRDIERTKYKIVPSRKLPSLAAYTHEDGWRDAVTWHWPLADIYFSIAKLTHYDLSWTQLKELTIQLAFHEHTRHFGFRDEDYYLGRLVATDYGKDVVPGVEKNRCAYNKWDIAKLLAKVPGFVDSPYKVKQVASMNPEWADSEDCPAITSLVGNYAATSDFASCAPLKIDESSPLERTLIIEGFHTFRAINTRNYLFYFQNRDAEEAIYVNTKLQSESSARNRQHKKLRVIESWYHHADLLRTKEFVLESDGSAHTIIKSYQDSSANKTCRYRKVR